MVPRLKEQYNNDMQKALKEKFQYANVMDVPKLDKIVVNMGVGDGPSDPKLLEAAMAELALITGQRPSKRKAKNSISGFKLREGTHIGCAVTLRGARMYEFLDRLVNIAIPRIRDFRGVSLNAFDKQGNYTLGLREQTIFPEIKVDAVGKVRGMSITFVVKGKSGKEQSKELLRLFGMPFRN